MGEEGRREEKRDFDGSEYECESVCVHVSMSACECACEYECVSVSVHVSMSA